VTQAVQADRLDDHDHVCHPGIEPPNPPVQHHRGQDFVAVLLDANRVAQQLAQHDNALEIDVRCQDFRLEAQVERQPGGSLCG